MNRMFFFFFFFFFKEKIILKYKWNKFKKPRSIIVIVAWKFHNTSVTTITWHKLYFFFFFFFFKYFESPFYVILLIVVLFFKLQKPPTKKGRKKKSWSSRFNSWEISPLFLFSKNKHKASLLRETVRVLSALNCYPTLQKQNKQTNKQKNNPPNNTKV